MAERAPPFLKPPLSGGRSHAFHSPSAFLSWLEFAEKELEWFLSGTVSRPRGVAFARTAARNFINEAREQAGRSGTDRLEMATAILSSATRHFPLGVPIAPDNPAIAAVRQRYEQSAISQEIGVGAVIYSDSVYAQSADDPMGHITHPAALQAMGLAGAAYIKWGRAGAAASDKNLTRAATEIEGMLAKAEQQRADSLEALNALMAEFVQRASNLIDTTTTSSSQAVEKIHETDRQFTEIMRLKAPMDQWTAKAAEHRNGVQTYRRRATLWNAINDYDF